MNYTFIVLIIILLVIMFLVPGKKKDNFENKYNNRLSIKSALKKIPNFVPHLLI